MCKRIFGIALLTGMAMAAAGQYDRDPNQKVDEQYTQQIKKYTTEPALNSPLTDYLPASNTVPTPATVLGDVAGAPKILPYAEDVYKYFRMLAAATPRVQVFTIGKSEEGREMIAAAIADESLLADRKANDGRLAKLADPRTIQMDDAKAAQLVDSSVPVYYITGTIHSVETGAPTALMELAYRLAVDDSPYIQFIRTHMIVLITPVVEVDGRDRMVDIYKWHLAHPGQNWPHLLYWGHYVAHDNNRDAMGMTLQLTRNVLNTYLDWHAQVLHDLHESVPFLYDNTVGDGPYNAWVDPLLTDEWAALGWNNVGQMQAQGMPGVFTHGNFDTWSPGYLMFLAAMHNGISRLYETFGNGGADTEKRILRPEEWDRTWFRPNPPYPEVEWSQRDNNNYEQTALLTTLSYFAHNTQHFLTNFYLKSKRSVQKPHEAGPAAYILPATTDGKDRQLALLHALQLQHVEISQLDEPVSVLEKKVAGPTHDADKKDDDKDDDKSKKKKDEPVKVAAGSYIVRLDQPYSRIADALLDRQYWSPDDPQKEPYDDTGWSFGDLFNVKVIRATDASILNAKMHAASIDAPEPAVKKQVARIAVMHTWLYTQTEGWWRLALDNAGVKYDYISTQTAAKDADLRSKYDVIIFAPTEGTTEQIVNGLPMYGAPIPWEKTELTPNIGILDSTPDMRPGLGFGGVENLRKFVDAGGMLITCQDTAEFAIEEGLAPGVFIATKKHERVVGSVLGATIVDKSNPVASGYSGDFGVYSAEGMAFTVANTTREHNVLTAKDYKRPTGRGGPDDEDVPEGRPARTFPQLPSPKAWDATPLNEEQVRNNPYVIPEADRPKVIVRFADSKDLLRSGLLDGGDAIAEKPIVVLAHYGKGHVLLFANNPMYRGETIGSYPLVLNAITNFDAIK